MVAVLRRAGDRLRTLFETIRSSGRATSHEVSRAIWDALAGPQSIPFLRLSFEVYGIALHDRRRFPEFDARIRATLVLACSRGCFLELCATNDRERIDRAVELCLTSAAFVPAMLDDNVRKT